MIRAFFTPIFEEVRGVANRIKGGQGPQRGIFPVGPALVPAGGGEGESCQVRKSMAAAKQFRPGAGVPGAGGQEDPGAFPIQLHHT